MWAIIVDEPLDVRPVLTANTFIHASEVSFSSVSRGDDTDKRDCHYRDRSPGERYRVHATSFYPYDHAFSIK